MKNLPDKIFLNLGDLTEEEYNETDFQELSEVTWSEDDVQGRNVEYVRKDAFIEKAAQFLYDYNQKQVIKHGARATLGCGEYTINVDEFRKYIRGE
jgi:hypothetical protein